MSMNPYLQWIQWPERKPEARLRMFCIPCAGRGASVFNGWGALLPRTVEVALVQPPGREARIAQPAFTRVGPLVEALFDAMAEHLDRRYVIFGHSMGALVAFELTRRIRRVNAPGPSALLLAGARAPHLPRPWPPIHHLPQAQFVEALARFQGTPPETLSSPALLDLLMPMLRADFAACETYVHATEAPLACPIRVFGGRQDEDVSLDDLNAWRQHTTADAVARLLPGNHFFVYAAASGLLPLLAQELEQIARAVSPQAPTGDSPRAAVTT